MNPHEVVRTLYRKFLALYPQEFSGQLGESMAQTFNDLYNKKRQSQSGMFGFVVWTFAETTLEITREHVLQMTKGDTMNHAFTNLKSPALIGLLLVLPLMIMELVNRRTFNEGFPMPIFALLWLLAMLFFLILLPIVRNMQAGNSLLARPLTLVVSLVFLAVIAVVWTGIVVDQMPCFLGVPLCD